MTGHAGQQSATPVCQDPENKAHAQSHESPGQKNPSRAEMQRAKNDGGDHQAKAWLHGPPEKDLLCHRRDQGQEDNLPCPQGAEHQRKLILQRSRPWKIQEHDSSQEDDEQCYHQTSTKGKRKGDIHASQPLPGISPQPYPKQRQDKGDGIHHRSNAYWKSVHSLVLMAQNFSSPGSECFSIKFLPVFKIFAIRLKINIPSNLMIPSIL